jgi:hypothetical protein
VVVTPAPSATPPNAAANNPPAPAPAAPQVTPPPEALATAVQPPTTSPGLGQAQIIISPSPTMRVGGGPYTVPISVTNALGLSTISLTLVYDPAKLRVRSVQQGSFLRTGGIDVVFTNQVNGGRVDITLARAGDATGASGTGLLAAVLFDAIAPGAVTLTTSGAATGPGGAAMGLQFQPVTVTVQ